MTGRLALIASYPKSGNTWMRAVVDSLRHGGAAVDINTLGKDIFIAASRSRFDALMGVAASDLTDEEIHRARADFTTRLAELAPERQFLKVHDALLPAVPGAAPSLPADTIDSVVYVSFANHLAKTIDEAIALMAKADHALARSGPKLPSQLPQFVSSWSRHVESWLDAPGIRLLAISYEAMVDNPAETFAAVADFLALAADSAMVARAAAAADFRELARQEALRGFHERPAEMAEPFFRFGTAGGWRKHLTEAQRLRIETGHGPMMRRLGYLP